MPDVRRGKKSRWAIGAASGRAVAAAVDHGRGRSCRSRRCFVPVLAVILSLGLAPPAGAQQDETRPYDEKLFQLAEILGAMHYLRELCGQNDGQLWRDRMRDLLEGEASSAQRRANLARRFNNGYRSFGRTYQTCTPNAQAAIAKFLNDGIQIGEGLLKNVQ
jgi:uncharacterized protein (TIGR02301 family)